MLYSLPPAVELCKLTGFFFYDLITLNSDDDGMVFDVAKEEKNPDILEDPGRCRIACLNRCLKFATDKEFREECRIICCSGVIP